MKNGFIDTIRLVGNSNISTSSSSSKTWYERNKTKKMYVPKRAKSIRENKKKLVEMFYFFFFCFYIHERFVSIFCSLFSFYFCCLNYNRRTETMTENEIWESKKSACYVYFSKQYRKTVWHCCYFIIFPFFVRLLFLLLLFCNTTVEFVFTQKEKLLFFPFANSFSFELFSFFSFFMFLC